MFEHTPLPPDPRTGIAVLSVDEVVDRECDTIVIGGGVIGLGIAWRLARAGLSVIVLERNALPVGEASWAAAGMLAPLAELEFDEFELHRFAALSQELWPQLVDELNQDAAASITLDTAGTLMVGVDPDDAAALQRRAQYMRKLGLPVQQLTGAEAREREPLLDPAIASALWCAGDIQVDNRAVAVALAHAAVQRGVRIAAHAEVRNITLKQGVIAELTDGRGVRARQVVLAAGAWTRSIEGLQPDVNLPVRPVRGQMMSFAWPKGERLLRHVVRGPDAYLVPKADRLVVGATSEERGFERALTGGGLLQLLEGARDLCPALLECNVLETWCGFRPGSRDNQPLLGPTGLPGVFVATGHYRNGIQLTAATLHAMERCLLLGDTSLVHEFQPDRFQTRRRA
jgi:glycine oxidase